MNNPIIQRELIGILRTRTAVVLQVGLVLLFTLLVMMRWPTEARVDLSGSESQRVFRLFGFGLLTAVLALVPVFPATSLVRERNRGTLALLLNSPLHPIQIYWGKLAGVLAFTALLLLTSVPAAAACYAMGGISLTGHLTALYAVLVLVAIQYTTLAMFVSSRANSTDSAVRITYTCVLGMAVFSLVPHLLMQGRDGWWPEFTAWLQCASPIPAVMRIVGYDQIGGLGTIQAGDPVERFLLLAALTTGLFVAATVARLNYRQFDRPRDEGRITDEQSQVVRIIRRLMFVVDPQRRKAGIASFVNPVMVKEFRSRRFGRFHWLLRRVGTCAVASLLLAYAVTSGTIDWRVESIGGPLVLLQVALIVLITPSLAAGLISSERESGGWQLLQMTPLSPARIVRGKVASVGWILVLVLSATVPGYLVMIYIKPDLWLQVYQAMVCLVLTAVFALTLSAALGSMFRRTATATTVAYVVMLAIFAGPMLFWLGREAPFGHRTVEFVLSLNSMAAALAVFEIPGFDNYELLPFNWWFMASVSLLAVACLAWRTWRLARPQ